jgi:hypothetical protein
MSAVANLPADVDRVLQLKTVRDATARGHFLAGVREYGRDGAQFSLERLESLMRIEEHFHALLVYDQIEFLRGATPGSEDERDFALNIQRICLEAANGFQRYLRHRNAWATTREGLDVMFRVTGLALNAIHSFVKWGYFLNEPGRSAPWKQLHALYLLADADGYSQVPFVLHPSQPSFKPTVQSLYLRTLLLDVLHTGNLTKVQIEIADGWLSSWCNEYALEAEYVPKRHLFFVDVASDSGMHLMRRDSQGEAMRFVGAEALRAQIAEVQAGLRHGRLYAGYGAGAVFPVEEHVALLAIVEKLYLALLSGDENRIEERTHFEDREVDVTVGIERVLRKVREGPSDLPAASAPRAASSMMDTIEITPAGLSLVTTDANASGEAVAAGDAEVERWRVHDLSSKGFGLIVDRGAADGVMLNGLVALRNQETGGWIVGSVVRKLANRVRGEMLVGVEVLAYRPIAVEIVPAAVSAPVPALYVPGVDTNGKLDALILRASDFGRGNSFVLAAGGARYRIRLNRMIKKGADWVLARFEIESKA